MVFESRLASVYLPAPPRCHDVGNNSTLSKSSSGVRDKLCKCFSKYTIHTKKIDVLLKVYQLNVRWERECLCPLCTGVEWVIKIWYNLLQ
jgi:hypothetical protein